MMVASAWQFLMAEWAFGLEAPLLATIDFGGDPRRTTVGVGEMMKPGLVYVSPTEWEIR